MAQLLWSQRSNFGPRSRTVAAMAFDVKSKCTVMAGGFAAPDNALLNDTWQWDGNVWVQIADMGPSAQTFAMAYVTSLDQMVLLAATLSRPGHLFPCQTWVWDGSEWTQIADVGPPNPSMSAYDQARDRIVVLATDFAKSVETWEWDGKSWTQVEDSGPSPRYAGALAYDVERQRIVLFGGLDLKDNPVGDTWEWDGKAWMQLARFGPCARAIHKMVYDSTRKCTVLFGGLAGSPAQGNLAPPDTWEWDGKRWTQRQDMGPSSRTDPAMAFDSGRSRIVLFGGSTGSGETWEFMQWPPAA